jgi:tetratricopeptide (TPR) repeat protein
VPLLVAATEQIPQQVLDWKKTAQNFASKGDTSQAVEYYQKFIEAAPNDPMILIDRGELTKLYIKNKQNQDADAQIEAIKAEPSGYVDKSEILCKIAQSLQAVGQNDKALALHTYNASLSASSPAAYWSQVEIALRHVRTKNLAAAQSACDTLKTRYANQPTLPREIYTVAKEYVKTGQVDKAIELYQASVECPPSSDASFTVHNQWDDPDMYRIWSQKEIACCYADQGQDDKAILAVQKMLEQFGNRSIRYTNQPSAMKEANCFLNYFIEKGESAKAAKFCNAILAKYPADPQLIWVEGAGIQIDLSSDKFDTAESRLRQFKTKYAGHPDYAEQMSWIGREYCRAGLYKRAAEVSEEVSELNPGRPVRMYCLVTQAKVQARLGDDAKVQESVNTILTNYNQSEDYPAGYLFGIGEEYYYVAEDATRAGDPNGVIAAYQKALDIWETGMQRLSLDSYHGPNFAYYSGIACQQMGKYEQAIIYYQRVVEKWPEYDKAWFAQYRIAKYCEELAKQNKVSLDVVKAAYQLLKDKYPESVGAEVAVQKLGSI